MGILDQSNTKLTHVVLYQAFTEHAYGYHGNTLYSESLKRLSVAISE